MPIVDYERSGMDSTQVSLQDGAIAVRKIPPPNRGGQEQKFPCLWASRVAACVMYSYGLVASGNMCTLRRL